MSTPSWSDVAAWILRAPGGGIPTYSAGTGGALTLQKRHFAAVSGSEETDSWDTAAIQRAWCQSFERLKSAKVALIGVPLDTGAGIRRGAAYGPRAVRGALLDLPEYRAWLRSGAVIDLGDVFVNPHLLHDEMLSAEQRRACQDEMYAQAPEALRASLAVSGLSQLKQALLALQAAHPQLKLFVLGGDHSVAWPVTEALAAKYPGSLGIVQPDAHTDLLPSRLGVKYCFGTWSFHANELIGSGGRMVQLGIRQSGRDRAHWESTTGVRQFWANEMNGRPVKEVVAEIVAHLKATGVKQIYFSNDIDGTDAAHASATGTPAEAGLTPELLLAVIEALGSNFELVAADVMEVAPDLGPTPEATAATSALAARYSAACLKQLLK